MRGGEDMLKKVFLTAILLVLTMFMIISCSGENSLTGGSIVNLEVEDNVNVEEVEEETSGETTTDEDNCESCEGSYNECQDTCEGEFSGSDLETCTNFCNHKYCYCSEKECGTSPSIC